MGLHAYCIAPAGHRADGIRGIRGIAGAVVRSVAEGPLELWVSEHETRPDASMDAAREHNAVVVAAMTEKVTPVPIRFGQWLRDDAAAGASISTSHEHWVALLEKFAGAVEFGIRIFDPTRDAAPAEAPANPASGREYMEALARRQQAQTGAAEVLAALRQGLAGVIIEEKAEPLRTAHGVASVAHLVRTSETDAYRNAVEAVRAGMPRLRLLSTGPWPPYSFVA